MRERLLSWTGSGATLRHRGVTLAILTAACLLMLFGAGKGVVKAYDNMAKADRLAAISLILSGLPENALPVTLLDVDDQTRQGWNTQGATPHQALAALIDLARANKASAILVDFDLSMEQAKTPANAQLLHRLQNYPADAPPLLLVRRFIFARTKGQVLATGHATTPYDDAVTGKANVTWVSALQKADGDRVVRKVLLWQHVCEKETGSALPSAALALAAVLEPDKGRVNSLPEFLKDRADAACKPDTSTPPKAWPSLSDPTVVLPFAFADTPRSPALFQIKHKGRDTVVLRRIPAGSLVNIQGETAQAVDGIDSDPFADRVVVIGASYTGSGDIYETPLGAMSGSVILANSLVQAQTLVEAPPERPFVKNLLSVLLFVAFAALARYLVAVAAVASIGTISIAALFVLSRTLGYASGFDIVAVALSGFAIFKLVDMAVQILLQVPKKGWSVLLKH